ncbi:hypothetical protein FOCC_FOCC003808 [Frankliniella occidentalis]|nr:hypothetical protein FOCC_FOCC003808 [Frankliniella occidentalis]
MDSTIPLNINFDDLTDDERDDIAQSLCGENLDKSNNINQLKSSVKLLQRCLGFKVEQVISLGLELDELASKQGAEEARLVQELNDLRAQLTKSSRENIQNGVESEDDIRQLLHVSELNAQKLLAEVQAQEQEQLSNKIEIEKLESQLAAIENDRLQLKRELSALKEEIHDQHKEVETDMQEPQKKHHQLVESLRQKNKHLSHLLNDIETSEKENIVLREKLTNVKIELAEATKNIMHITGDIVTLQITKEELSEKLRHSEQMCEALSQQIQELVSEKEKRDAELECFEEEVDVRIQEWKEIAILKEGELSDLREQLTHQSLKGQYIMKNCESEQIILLSQTLQKRESQIDELQSQLTQATKDLNETTSLLENMHRASELSQAGPVPKDIEVTEKQLLAAEEKIKILEEKLQDAENDAVGKSEEITKLIIQLRGYEAGEFGLTEALAQIKELSLQKAVRDKHIEQLVETANSLRHTSDCLQEENLTLRERLHISPEEQVLTSTVVLKNKEQNVYKVQQQRIDRLEEDLISAKMDRRFLSQQILSLKNKLCDFQKHPQDVQKPGNKQQNRQQADARAAARKIRALQQEQRQLDNEHQVLIEENEALRQGLHDILDSVHNQDGKSNVRLESKVLEQLLHALDSRHISGWYHPAMRIQAKVNAVEGSNEALREQLHSMREEELKIQDELHKAKLHIAELEGNMTEAQAPSHPTDEACSQKLKTEKESLPFVLPVELSAQGCDLISKMNNHLLQVLHDEIKSGIVKDIYNAVDLLAEKEKYCRIAKSALQYAQNTKNQCKVTKSEWNTSKDRLMKQMKDLLKFKENKSSMKIKQLMTELEQERDVKHDLARRLEDVNKKLWSKNIDSNDSSQELSTLLARTEAEALRDKHHAQHAEKMAGIIKEEVKLLSGRCSMLEEEVVALLKTNQENKIETSFFCHLCSIRNKSGDEDSVESQLSKAQAEELADISQAQVQMLDQLHERSELQLDSLRQVLYKLQGETDLSSELVRLSEELCASQVSEMSAWNQITSLEKWNSEVLEANETQAKEIEELNNKLNVEKQQFLEQFGKMQEEIINLRGHSENTLPLPFFHLLVTAYTQCSAENKDLWHCLQDVKEELFSLKSDSEKDRVSCQQTLELQRAIQASHSDVECQRLMELWAAELTELKINALKSTRLLDTLESNLKQAHERLQNREMLLSSLEQQMLSFGTKSEDDHLKEQIKKYQEEILKLNEILKSKENELESGRNLLRDMQHSLQNKEVSLQRIEHSQHVNSGILESCDSKFTNEDKIALQATVDSLQNIIVQKEDTISRYQKFLQDIREEDGRIISALQEHLRVQQADLTAQEQAYVRLKISMRQLSLEVNGENYSKASLNLHLMRSNELEDEVALLKAKVQAQSSELQQKQQEASYWRSAVQQHLSCIEDLNNRLSDSGNVEKKPPLSSPSHEKLMPSPSKSIILTTSLNKNYFEKQNWRRPRAMEGYSKVTESQIHMQINSEVTELRNKIQQMEEQEQRQKNEIQRLRDQIPIYSRRVHQSQAGAILPERETELLKKIKSMDQQMEQLKADHEKTLLQHTQQESKKVKSAENVARWDERKKHQIQIERLKSSLQEQTDETALLLDKVDRMHSTIHRLEREKIALEHQLKNLLHVQQEKTMLEERLKNLENNELTQCMFEELQNDRDKLLKEVQTLRVKGSASNVENKLSSTMLCELNSQKDEMYTKTKAQREKDISRDNDRMKHQSSNAAERDKANLLKANLELECQNLELKLELEKLRAEAPCLRHKVTHLERLLNATQEQKIAQSSAQPFSETLGMEEKTNLQQLVRHLSAQLEAANQRVQSLENFSDNGKLAALQTELSQKSLLLGKVKILLERAAFKERQLTEQVCRLQSEIDLK